ncbi:MAG: prepilin-type N-terminal cleavage/methylation domain-containing protein [Desulfosarcinaceae bacterium]|nr:prepilin-type N-terminal cleavage/methylation domain-containing protein [Desulfosarcinaceae bacterium]
MGPLHHTLRQRLHDDRGFTLIEMAIVLIIIGIIIGAVVKGKDIVRSAEQKKLYSEFVREWQIAFNNYYDRTGWILADSNDPNNAGTRDGHSNDGTTAANITSQLTNVGLTPPSQGSTGSVLQRTYTDSTGAQRTLTIAFDWKASLGNFIRVTGIPNDLGLAIDRLVDGSADGLTGDIQYTDNHGPGAPNILAWPSATQAPDGNDAMILKLQF